MIAATHPHRMPVRERVRDRSGYPAAGNPARSMSGEPDGVITGTPKPSPLFDVTIEEKAA